MAEYHLTWPEHEITLEEPATVLSTLRDLDGRFARDRRSVLVGIDSVGGSLDVALGLLHTAVWITTEEEPGYVALGSSSSSEEVMLEFDGDPTPFPASTLVDTEEAFAAVAEFLATDERPRCLAWQEF